MSLYIEGIRMAKLYFSYDKGRYLTEEQYIRHLTKKWLKEAGLSIERIREVMPQIVLEIGEQKQQA
jgi:DNA-binding transcriptional MerR regulator